MLYLCAMAYGYPRKQGRKQKSMPTEKNIIHEQRGSLHMRHRNQLALSPNDKEKGDLGDALCSECAIFCIWDRIY